MNNAKPDRAGSPILGNICDACYDAIIHMKLYMRMQHIGNAVNNRSYNLPRRAIIEILDARLICQEKRRPCTLLDLINVQKETWRPT